MPRTKQPPSAGHTRRYVIAAEEQDVEEEVNSRASSMPIAASNPTRSWVKLGSRPLIFAWWARQDSNLRPPAC